ncbi:germin-like protein subfamily 3 member 4 [Cicer arietinum]|uniref:Germin-like protein n=1 Tax=Cicer arietinum TaxID=3827 RepID=A0A1S2Z5A0_CICAR|nr:germin-like protein subfamily 3 member 4 [Cicer arietinum]
MKSFVYYIFFVFFFVVLANCDNLQDTCPSISPNKQTTFINGLPCKNPNNVTAQDFKTMELSKPSSTDIFGASVKLVNAAAFPGLNTLGLSIGRINIDKDGLVNFHYHPRASEIIFVTKGVLIAGFIDTQNQVFQNVLKVGDVCVFPKGLFHYILNQGFEEAIVFSVFNSQNPGQVSIVPTTFDTTLESLDKVKNRIISLSTSQLRDDVIS